MRYGVGLLAVLLSFVLGLPPISAADDYTPGGSFVDDDGNPHEPNIEAIKLAGITLGCNPPLNDRFCPSQPVTRGQMAAFLTRALALQPPGGEPRFVDTAGSGFVVEIEALAAVGITRGCNLAGDRFCPSDPLTRGEMAAFLTRAFGYTASVPGRFVDDDDSIFEADIERLAAAGVTLGCNPPANDRFCPLESVLRDQMASFLARARGLPQVSPPVVVAPLVNTIQTFALVPPSPDPNGIAFVSTSGRLLIADAEVEETLLFAQANLYSMSFQGLLVDVGVTTSFSKEPTGLSFDPDTSRLFVSDDERNEVFVLTAGPDGRFGTLDDVMISTLKGAAFGIGDAEGVAYDSLRGHLLIIDGRATELYRVEPGPNGLFDGVDDVVTHMDVGVFGVGDTEGVAYDRVRDRILVVDNDTRKVLEFTGTGRLARIIDIQVTGMRRPAGIEVAPGSLAPETLSMYVVDRGRDNSAASAQNDGRLYEFTMP